MPGDPGQALKWALDHFGDAWWVVGLIVAAIAWTSQRLRDFGRRNTLAISRAKLAAVPEATPASAAAYAAAASYAASGYAAQPAFAASPAAKLNPQRVAKPVARSVDVPAGSFGGRILGGAFGDPVHARNAIVLAEIVGPPVALR